MSTSVTLPALGESVTEGTVSRWLKQVGDTVEADEPLLEVSTDKVDTEIPSPTSGVLLEIKAQEDETVEVGAVLAVIGEPNEADGQAAAAPEAPSEGAAEVPAQEAAPQQEAPQREAPQQEAPQQEAPQRETPQQEAQQAEAPQESEKPEADAETAGAAPAPSSGGAAAGTDVTLPELGESVTEGTVSRWLKQVGDPIAADEPLLEVSTDKVDTEIPSPTSGTLLDIRVQEDETVEVGTVLAIIGEAGAAATPLPEPEPSPEPERRAEPPAGPEPRAEPERQPEPQAQPAPQPKVAAATAKEDARPEQHGPAAPATAAPTPVAGDSDTTYVTPLVRKLAKEHGVELASLNGTGVGGRIRKQDVLAAAEAAKQEAEAAKAAPPQAPAEPAAAAAPAPTAAASTLRGTTEKMSRLRQTIAKRMVESLQVAAQLTATVEVDLTAISRIRAKA